jgi:hypothetical protein
MWHYEKKYRKGKQGKKRMKFCKTMAVPVLLVCSEAQRAEGQDMASNQRTEYVFSRSVK